MTWYTDNDPFACEWLGNLVAAGRLPRGVVRRADVRFLDLRAVPAGECHFFAGIGGWPLALRLAGWPAGREVWTGSCPCQPFSAAGQQRGRDDERHLWPHWLPLIAEHKPPVIFGEQVAGAAGREWLAGVRADLENLGYAVGAADLCAAGVGAPHIRQRLFWVANAAGERLEGRYLTGGNVAARSGELCPAGPGDDADGLGDVDSAGRGARNLFGVGTEARSEHFAQSGSSGGLADAVRPGRPERGAGAGDGSPAGGGGAGGLGDADLARPQGRRLDAGAHPGQRAARPAGEPGFWSAFDLGGLADAERSRWLDTRSHDGEYVAAGRSERSASLDQRELGEGRDLAAGFWSDFDLLPCLDGKARRVEPGIFPLAHGVPARVGRLRAYGNAIVPQVAAAFIRAFLETERAGEDPRLVP
jgi:DNA (cytosine-5)-methyltransferase 1